MAELLHIAQDEPQRGLVTFYWNDGRTTQSTLAEYQAEREAKTTELLDVAEARREALARNEEIAREKRLAAASTDDATKLAVYREKYATALAALDGDPDALATLAPEATARGETPEQLAALVKSLGDAWIAAGLQIDATYQGHKAAILAAATAREVMSIDLTQGWPR